MIVNVKKALDAIKEDAFKIKGFKERYEKVVEEVLASEDLLGMLKQLDFSGPQIMLVLELLIAADEAATDDNQFLKEMEIPLVIPPKASC